MKIDFSQLKTAEQKATAAQAEAQAAANAAARKYLAETDWYVVRKTETGVEIPVEVAEARAEARLAVI